MTLPSQTPPAEGSLVAAIRQIWEGTRTQVARTVNTALVQANWLIGREIVEAQQAGQERAGYGESLLENLSQALRADYGSGFSVSALKYKRQFYLAFPELLLIRHTVRGESEPGRERIGHALRDELTEALAGPSSQIPHALRDESEWNPGQLHPDLSWIHYRALLKVDQREARDFYEIEAIRNGWSGRALERQIDSLLFFRLAKSRDKAGLMALANEGQQVMAPLDAIKDPYVLEFLDLPESHRLVESKLEEALISKLQDFLLELGSGFAFVGRQKRITLDGDHFYPDLVFYHTRLKCYVVIDLKTAKLTHGDLGQMQLYVRYFDQEVAEIGDNPTLGLILCTDKNDAVVRLVLGDDNQQVYASRYKLHLPTEDELRAELDRELAQLQDVKPKRTRKKA